MKILYVFIGILVTLLFVGGPDYESSRLIQYTWDTGHIYLFSAVVYALLASRKIPGEKQLKIIIIITASSFAVGFLIEVVQLYFNRDYELHDVLNDVLGALIGYILFRIIQAKQSLLRQKLKIGILLVLLLSGFYQLLGVIVDEFMMREEFPVLADFEYINQFSRWDNKRAKISLSKQHVREGKYSLKVIFLPDEFPDITLQHFPHDWSGFHDIGFSLFNPVENGPVNIELKIYDKEHINNGYAYNDRFNRVFSLHSGWNDIVVSLDDVFNAPAGRMMDMKQIKSFSLFLSDVTKPVNIFIDDIKLF